MQKKDSQNSVGTVLLAEDDMEVRKLVKEILTRDGYTVFSTSDGPGAWEMVKSRDFDLIIIDMGLPVMDGLELLRNIRENNIEKPILLVSGVKIDEKIITGITPNFSLVYKPFKINELKDAVAQLLNPKKCRSKR
jgi:DNA-binding response OmpR family regulator